MRDEHVDLFKCALVQQQVDPLPCGQLSRNIAINDDANEGLVTPVVGDVRRASAGTSSPDAGEGGCAHHV